jgi:hypothetical protein
MPLCGLYRTTEQIGPVPAGRLVYFHNHGNPGPGIYMPTGWKKNRATFSEQGVTLPSPEAVKGLKPLLAEGLYRVEQPFTCCDKNCRTFETDMLVQLGYNGEARPILFVPQWTDAGLEIPERGQAIDELRLARLEFLVVSENRTGGASHLH